MENKNEKGHLPMYGVGPIYVGVIIVLTALGIALTIAGVIPSAGGGVLNIPLKCLGALLIAFGAYLWYAAVIRAKIDKGIEQNRLVTDGIYAWVRNPIYSAFMLVCTGALLICGNLWLLALPLIYWALMTALMKRTEEKWLEALYGQEYRDYCARVNRCIPVPRRR